MTDDKLPFTSHLKELRDRLLICIIALAVAFVFTYYFKEKMFLVLMQPFIKVMPAKSAFIFTGVTEAFITYFKISFVMALFVGSPVILYEVWMFVAPGLYDREKKFAYPFMIFGSLCFILGAVFCYFVVLPISYRFFVSYAAEFIIPMPDLKSYMNLTLKMLLIFGLIFELPLAAFFLTKARIINAKMLSSKRRYAILGIFILSAIITPPDLASQLLMVIPLWALYEVSVLITRLFGRKKETEDEGA